MQPSVMALRSYHRETSFELSSSHPKVPTRPQLEPRFMLTQLLAIAQLSHVRISMLLIWLRLSTSLFQAAHAMCLPRTKHLHSG